MKAPIGQYIDWSHEANYVPRRRGLRVEEPSRRELEAPPEIMKNVTRTAMEHYFSEDQRVGRSL